jgi:hypothetical protein
MKTLSLFIAISFSAFLSSPTHAAVVGETKVLLARNSSALSTTIAQDMLSQINTTFDNSGLGDGAFVSAKFDLLGQPEVFTVDCGQTIAEDLLSCVRTKLRDQRNQYAADIVLVLVPFLDLSSIGDEACGAVMEGMVNAYTISDVNRHLAYAAVETTCFAIMPDGLKVASHEVGHLLSIEHKADTAELLPVVISGSVEDNHAAVVGQQATVTAASYDCVGFTCNYSDFFSEAGKNFSGGSSAGDSSHSNAVDVISSHSWPVVSAYRPLPQAESCYISINQVCDGGSLLSSVTPVLSGGYSMSNIDVDYRRINSSTWYPIYDGAPTCPIYNAPSIMDSVVRALVTTAAGYTTGCTVEFQPLSCGGSGGPGGHNN